MRYDTVVLYSNKYNEKTCKFYLLLEPPVNSAREQSVTVARASSCRVLSYTHVRPRCHAVPADLPLLGPCDPPSTRYNYGDNSDADNNSDAKDVEDIAKDDDGNPWLVSYTDPDDWILVTEDELESV